MQEPKNPTPSPNERKLPSQRMPSRFEAQVQLGLFAPHDYVMACTVAFTALTMFFWWLFGRPSVLNFIAVLLVLLIFVVVWLLAVAYRIIVLILDLHADISLMPDAAARLVVGYHEGRAQPKPAVPGAARG